MDVPQVENTLNKWYILDDDIVYCLGRSYRRIFIFHNIKRQQIFHRDKCPKANLLVVCIGVK